MRWKGRRESENVEDRRGLEEDAPGGGFSLEGLPRGGKGLKLGGGLGLGSLVIVGVALLLGADPSQILGLLQAGAGGAGVTTSRHASSNSGGYDRDGEKDDFAKVVLADTEDVWNDLYPASHGRAYREPTLVLFHDSVRSACGAQGAEVGPFYCPADEKVYIDLGFFDQLAQSLGAPGDFAQAYVIAHEVGHHVQNLLGTSTEVHRRKRSVSEAEGNELSVRLELQADYYAGVWAHHAQRRFQILEPGDLDEALRAANRIGDDTLQKRSRGYAVPDSFTHGTSAQRERWFRLGFESGDPRAHDPFQMAYEDL